MAKQTNLSRLMKRAWELYKSVKNSLFSECLKEAWREAKTWVSVDDFKSAMFGLSNYYYDNAKREAYALLNHVIDDLKGFAAEVAQTVLRYKRCSSKQLYWVARGLAESGKYTVRNGMVYGV